MHAEGPRSGHFGGRIRIEVRRYLLRCCVKVVGITPHDSFLVLLMLVFTSAERRPWKGTAVRPPVPVAIRLASVVRTASVLGARERSPRAAQAELPVESLDAPAPCALADQAAAVPVAKLT